MTQSRWTHSVCLPCWRTLKGERPPVTMAERENKVCCLCGRYHTSGVFVRDEPNKYRCKGEHKA